MKTISYIYYTRYRPDSAHGIQILHTINALTDLGYTVQLNTARDVHTFAEANDIHLRASTHSPPTSVGNETLDRILYYSYALRQSLSADIIFTRDISFLKFISVLPITLQTPVLYEAHKSYSGMGQMTKAEERTRVTEADIVITQSPGVKEDLEALDLPVNAVVPNAANDAYLPAEYPHSLAEELGVTEETTTIVYSGSLYSWKNDLELLIQAVSGLANSELRLLIVGGDTDRIAELKQFVHDQSMDASTVTFVGRVPHREVFNYLVIADVGVIPLKSGNAESLKYTSPIKLFEYKLCDLPTVAADVPALNRFNDESLYKYNPGDREAMQRMIDAAISNLPTTTEKFTYHHRAQQIQDIIETELV